MSLLSSRRTRRKNLGTASLAVSYQPPRRWWTKSSSKDSPNTKDKKETEEQYTLIHEREIELERP